MAIKGLTILETRDESRVKEICEFILSLDFKKPVMVDIEINEEEPAIYARVARTKYHVRVNPNIELNKIKEYLLEKGYITD